MFGRIVVIEWDLFIILNGILQKYFIQWCVLGSSNLFNVVEVNVFFLWCYVDNIVWLIIVYQYCIIVYNSGFGEFSFYSNVIIGEGGKFDGSVCYWVVFVGMFSSEMRLVIRFIYFILIYIF